MRKRFETTALLLCVLLTGFAESKSIVEEEGLEVVVDLKKLKDELVQIFHPPEVPPVQIQPDGRAAPTTAATTTTTVAATTTITAANISRVSLACPIPKTWFVTERDERYCEGDTDCRQTEKCCDWFDKKHCLAGIDTTPSGGQCPKSGIWNDACLADHVSCQYDSECEGEDSKCCLNYGCGYMDCQSIRENLACPKTASPERIQSSANCSKDIECGFDEKCCEIDNQNKCLTGIDKTPTPGFCPAPVSLGESDCEGSQSECEYDSECSEVNHKCCPHPDCGHRVCSDINKDFACPATNPTAYPTNSSSTCTGKCAGFGMQCCPTGVSPRGELVNNCIPGVIHIPSPGQCPDLQADTECTEGASNECNFDSECWSSHKCCTSGCGYNKCIQPSDKKVAILERMLHLMEGGM